MKIHEVQSEDDFFNALTDNFKSKDYVINVLQKILDEYKTVGSPTFYSVFTFMDLIKEFTEILENKGFKQHGNNLYVNKDGDIIRIVVTAFAHQYLDIEYYDNENKRVIYKISYINYNGKIKLHQVSHGKIE